MSETRIARFDSYERAMHWMAALSFLYAALTGLALWSPVLYWMASLSGGGFVVRGTHPWSGIVFSVAIGWMYKRWARTMAVDADDMVWLTKLDKYATHQHGELPESGKFNAGQKMLFWSQVGMTLVLFASGVVLWFPAEMGRELRLTAVLLHPLAAIASIGGILVHIYMGTAAVPGSMRAMLRGWVVPEWARFHHTKWYRQWRDSGEVR